MTNKSHAGIAKKAKSSGGIGGSCGQSNNLTPGGAALDLVVKTWVATLLAVHHHMELSPETILASWRGSTGRAHVAKKVLCQAWMIQVGRREEATAWLQMTLRGNRRTLRQLATELDNPELLLDLALVVDSAQTIRQLLTQDHVAACIAAGWTGCGSLSGTPWRAARALLPLVPGWLEQARQQSPDGPASE